MVSAIVEASGDFNSYKQFPSTSRKSIIVIAGGGDECYSNASQLIKDRLDWLSDGKNSLRVRYHYIGYDVSESQKVALAKMAQITGGKLTFADDPIELSSRLQSAITNTDESVDVTKIIAASNLSNKRNRMELRGGGILENLMKPPLILTSGLGGYQLRKKSL